MRGILLFMVSGLIVALVTCNQIKSDAQEIRYTTEGFPLMLELNATQASRACHNEYQGRAENAEVADMLTLSNMSTLSRDGLMVCGVGFHNGLFNITMTAAETLYVPSRAALPYGLTKALTGVGEDSEASNCSHYVKIFLQACPIFIQSRGLVSQELE